MDSGFDPLSSVASGVASRGDPSSSGAAAQARGSAQPRSGQIPRQRNAGFGRYRQHFGGVVWMIDTD